MTDPVDVLGRWAAKLPGGGGAQLAVVGKDGRFALLYSDSDAWDALGYAYDREAARRAANLIAHLARMPEHVRIGGDGILSGLDTDHPGVEWVAPAEVIDDDDPAVRLTGPGTHRLWVVPSTDGEVLGLLNPDGDPRDIAEFVSAEAADAFIAVLDALLAGKAYGRSADDG